ncbi:GSCOCG00009797001-RA-CDS [Cotesia congregata]|nr:GSCOCG00009797001-RA-CDS [Cotesia congregata]
MAVDNCKVARKARLSHCSSRFSIVGRSNILLPTSNNNSSYSKE